MNEKIMIKTLIVDDEAPARVKLQQYVERDKRFCVVGQAKNGQEALNKISELQPQLVLLDIQMPGMTGFDVLRLIETASPAIIFTTAYDEYAVQAFEVSAIDYLLKPITEQRLQQALNKVISLVPSNWDEKIDNVLNNIANKEYAKRLAVRHFKRINILNTEDIAYIVSEHRLINIYNHHNERFWTNENLSQLEARLDPNHFMRIHRGAIINLSAQFEIETWDSGRLKLHFKTGNELVVSRDNVSRLRSYLDI
jgi:DNA-binding LytR/AlgR family response regulator